MHYKRLLYELATLQNMKLELSKGCMALASSVVLFNIHLYAVIVTIGQNLKKYPIGGFTISYSQGEKCVCDATETFDLQNHISSTLRPTEHFYKVWRNSL